MTGRIRRLWRSAITGRFVTALFARRHPDTTVVEHREVRPPIDDPDAR